MPRIFCTRSKRLPSRRRFKNKFIHFEFFNILNTVTYFTGVISANAKHNPHVWKAYTLKFVNFQLWACRKQRNPTPTQNVRSDINC